MTPYDKYCKTSKKERCFYCSVEAGSAQIFLSEPVPRPTAIKIFYLNLTQADLSVTVLKIETLISTETS